MTTTDPRFADGSLPELYTLHVQAGQRYALTLQDLEPGEAAYRGLSLWAWSDETPWPGGFMRAYGDGLARGIFAAAADGEVEVRAYGTAGHAYTLQVTTLPADDHGDIDDLATPVRTGGAASGHLDPDGDHDVFAFDLVAGQRVQFSVDDTSLSLWLTYGQSTVRWGQGSLSFEPVASGRYILGLDSETGQASDYTLQSRLAPDDHGDTPDTATPLPGGQAMKGQTDGVGDIDAFALDLAAGQRYELRLCADNMQSLGAQITTGGLWGTVLADAGDGSATAWLCLPDGGRADVQVCAGDGQVHPYTLTLTPIARDDHGDTTEDATAVQPGHVTGGRWNASADVDTFVVQAVAGQRYRLQLDSVDGQLPHGAAIVATDAQSPRTLGAWLFEGETGPSLTLTWRADRDGPFAFATSAPVDGGYLMRVDAVPADDHADSSVGATPLTPGIPLDGHTDAGNDCDCFSLDVVEGQRYRYLFWHADTWNLQSVAVMDDAGQCLAGGCAGNDGWLGADMQAFTATHSGRVTLWLDTRDTQAHDYTVVFWLDDSPEPYVPVDRGELVPDPLPAELTGVTWPTWDGTLQP